MTLTLALVIVVILLFILFIICLLFKNRGNEYVSVVDNPTTSPVMVEDGNKPFFDLMEWTDGCEIAVYRTGGLLNKRNTLSILSHTNVGPKSTAMVVGHSFMSRRKAYTYYGVYPASAFGVSRRKATVSGFIPKIQKPEQDTANPRIYKADMANYGYMYAISSRRSRDNEENNWNFQPLVNTLVFKFHSLANNYMKNKLVSIRLSSEQNNASLAGTFKTSLDPESGEHMPIQNRNISDGSNAIMVYFGHGIVLGTSPEEETVINLISIPMDQTKLTLSLRFDNGSTLSLKLVDKDDWITVKACKKTVFYNIVVPGKIIKYSKQKQTSVPTKK